MPHALTRTRLLLCLLAPLAIVVVLLGSDLTSTSAGDLRSRISASRAAAQALRSAIANESVHINATATGIARARAQLTSLEVTLAAREATLRQVHIDLIGARDHLVDLENRLHIAAVALAANLVARYENEPPSLMTVVLDANGFTQLLEQLSFLRRIGTQDALIVAFTRRAREQVTREVIHLAQLQQRDRVLTKQVLEQRNHVAALHAALIIQQIAQLSHRAHDRARWAAATRQVRTLTAALRAIEARAAAAAARARATASADVGGIAVNTGGMVQPPAGAPPAIAHVIAAANAIATLPYLYGGGHASFHANAYDCSASVSYALAAAGLVSAPMDSTEFESWGEPGPGRWITVFANADHAWMEVGGWRFDTVAQATSGTRWAQGGGEFSGFVERHPPGL